jgi:hypothetical protein
MKNKGLIFALGFFIVPFLTIIIITAIPFAFVYLIFELFKKPAIVEPKKQTNFFDYALKTYKNGISNN